MSPSLLALDENVVAECIRLVALDYGISHVAKVAETCQTFERICRNETMWWEILRRRGVTVIEPASSFAWRDATRRLAELRAVASRCTFASCADLNGAISSMEASLRLPPREEDCASMCLLIGTHGWTSALPPHAHAPGDWMSTPPAAFRFDGGTWTCVLEGALGSESAKFVVVRFDSDPAEQGWFHVLRARAWTLGLLAPLRVLHRDASFLPDAKLCSQEPMWSLEEADRGYEPSSLEMGWCPHKILKSLPVGRPEGFADDFMEGELEGAPDPYFQGMGFVLDVDAECVGLPSKGTQEAARQDTGGIALLVIESLLARGRGDVEVRDSGGRGIHMRGIMG